MNQYLVDLELNSTYLRNDILFSFDPLFISRTTKREDCEEFLFQQDPFEHFLEISQKYSDASGSSNSQALPIINISPGTSFDITVNQVSAAMGDIELATFVDSVRQIRSRFHHDEPNTNAGFVVCIFKVFLTCSLFLFNIYLSLFLNSICRPVRCLVVVIP